MAGFKLPNKYFFNLNPALQLTSYYLSTLTLPKRLSVSMEIDTYAKL